MKTVYRSFENARKFNYLGKTVTNQNSINEENNRKGKLDNACYYSVLQNRLSSRVLSKNVNIKIHKIIRLTAVFHGCETWSLTLKEEHRLGVFENRVLRRISDLRGMK
jgi:hypothetical protein